MNWLASKRVILVWLRLLYGTWLPINKLCKMSNLFKWPVAQKLLTPTPMIQNTLSMWNNSLNLWSIWPIQWLQPTLKKECVLGKSQLLKGVCAICVRHIVYDLFNIFRMYRVDRNKYQIHIPLPPKIDPTVTMMQVEDKPDVTYSDVGGCKEQIEKLREVVETPLLHVSFICVSVLPQCLITDLRNNFHRSRKSLSIWASNHQKVCYCLAHQVQEKLCVLALSPIVQMRASFVLLVQN